MNKNNAIILGAGITGLVTAWKLAKADYNVTIIEKDNRIGGLSGTMDWDGWKFDFGAHGFFTKHKEILDFYSKNFPEKLLPRKVHCEIYIFGKLIKYPLVGAQIFAALSKKQMIKSGVDFFFTRLRAFLFGIKDTEYLDDWIISRFGKTLYNIYFGPYISRIQKKEPRLLSKDIGLKKIPVFSIRQYLIRELTRNKKIHPNEESLWNTFYVKGGYGELPKFFYDKLKMNENVNIILGEEVKNIELDKSRLKKIITDKNIYYVEDCNIISTIPVEILINSLNCPSEIKKESNKLEYSCMRFFLLKTKLEKLTGNDWTMFNGEEFAFNRVSESWHDEFELVPEGCSSLTFEFPLNKEDRYWTLSDDELWDEIFPVFSKVFPFKKEDVIEYKSIWIDHSNPRMVLGYDKVLKNLFSYILEIENLTSFGRQGLFTYINLDGCTKMGFDFSESLFNSKEKQWLINLIKECHCIDLNQRL
jgi:protoporphyrinogen oxidase